MAVHRAKKKSTAKAKARRMRAKGFKATVYRVKEDNAFPWHVSVTRK